MLDERISSFPPIKAHLARRSRIFVIVAQLGPRKRSLTLYVYVQRTSTLQVEPCCWSTYSIHRDTQATLAILDKLDVEREKLSEEEIARLYGFEEEYNRGTLTKWQKLRPRIWALFDEPYSSVTAKCIACVSILFICLSVLCFCLKSHRTLERSGNNQQYGELLRSESNWNEDDVDSYPVLFYLEHACNAWFTLEITLRCLVRIKAFHYCCNDTPTPVL